MSATASCLKWNLPSHLCMDYLAYSPDGGAAATMSSFEITNPIKKYVCHTVCPRFWATIFTLFNQSIYVILQASPHQSSGLHSAITFTF